MNREQLQGEIERSIRKVLSFSPCPRCGGNPFDTPYNAHGTAYYIFELVKRYLADGKADFEKAKKASDKAARKYMSEVTTEELEKVLGVSDPTEPALPQETSRSEPPPTSPPHSQESQEALSSHPESQSPPEVQSQGPIQEPSPHTAEPQPT